ncbi:MAG: DUF4350 domain-containing protein [Geobacter sp.]|nr:DUF4350 domain-containing protein [Geobacter sp.]
MKKMRIGFVVLSIAIFAASAAFAGESLPRVLFDQGHAQQFLIEEKGELQLSKLADIIRGKGALVSSTAAPLNDQALQGITALVISGPFASLQPEEVEAVSRFIEKGGRLAAMLHIGAPLAGLLAKLDIDHSNAVLHDRKNIIDRDTNFIVKDLTTHPLFTGIEQFSLYGGWALKYGKEGAPIARTSPEAWVDLDGDKQFSKNDAVGSFAVVIAGPHGKGDFVIFGDDAIFQNRYLDGDNSKLAANLAALLTGH